MSITDTQAELERFRKSIAPQRGRRRTPWLAAAAAAAVVATGATAVVLSTDDEGARPGPADSAGPALPVVAPDDPAPLPSSSVLADLQMSGIEGDAAYPAGVALWRLATPTSVDRIDPASGQVTTIDLPTPSFGPFVSAAGLVWFTGRDGDEEVLHALDPSTNTVIRTVRNLPGARWVASGPAGLWVVTGERELKKIDPVSGLALRTVRTEQGVYDLHVGEHTLYAGAIVHGKGITVVDTRTSAVRTVLPDLSAGPFALTPSGDLWVNDASRGALVRYSGESFEEQASIDLGQRRTDGVRRHFLWYEETGRTRSIEGSGIDTNVYPVVADGVLYAAYNVDGSPRLLRADAATGEVRDLLDLGSGARIGPVTVTDDSLWIGWRGDDVVRRLALVP